MLEYLGDDVAPSVINLYPKDFNSKKEITNYLDEYNKNKSEKERIEYIDMASMISSLSGSIMDAITIVLIAFSSISLIVSSIMIAIITYISVLERTKEIGILRALGARGKDIKRVFNAETFIIGLTSGLLGILIAYLLTFPVNNIIYKLSELPNVAKLNPVHAIILITINVLLTMLGGFIPAKLASRKDPVEALRTE
jgi:putative ABC transport system permease protein